MEDLKKTEQVSPQELGAWLQSTNVISDRETLVRLSPPLPLYTNDSPTSPRQAKRSSVTASLPSEQQHVDGKPSTPTKKMKKGIWEVSSSGMQLMFLYYCSSLNYFAYTCIPPIFYICYDTGPTIIS